MQFAVFDLLIHNSQSLGSLGADHYALSVAVNAVAERGRKAQFIFRNVFAFVAEVVKNAVDEGVGITAFVLVYHKSDGLVCEEDIFVLVDYADF